MTDYQSDVQLNDSGRGPFRLRPESHPLDEFAASYSSAGCTPAVPASASPAGFYVPSASRNCKPPLAQGWGIFNRHNEEFSTGVDKQRELLRLMQVAWADLLAAGTSVRCIDRERWA